MTVTVCDLVNLMSRAQPRDDSLVGVETQTAGTQPFCGIGNTLNSVEYLLTARRLLEHVGTAVSRRRIGAD